MRISDWSSDVCSSDLLLVHILLDLVHGHMAGAFDHPLHIVLPGLFGTHAKGVEFGELSFVVRVRDAAGAETIAERECNIIARHDLADFLAIIFKETPLVVSNAHFGHDGAAARYDAGTALGRPRESA